MKINYKVNTLNLNDDMSELFCEIDSKIVNISRRKLNTLRYGLRDDDVTVRVLGTNFLSQTSL